jgi:hypothetical protein
MAAPAHDHFSVSALSELYVDNLNGWDFSCTSSLAQLKKAILSTGTSECSADVLSDLQRLYREG